jgi:murein endopeptidase
MALRVGDISKRGGGRIPDHGSHKHGKNVDLDLAFNDGRTTAEPNRGSRNATWRSPAYDRGATRLMVKLIKEAYPSAQILFNDPVLVREGLVRSYPNHDNHLHVQHLY